MVVPDIFQKMHTYFGQTYLFVFAMLRSKSRILQRIGTSSTTGLYLRSLEMHISGFTLEKWKKKTQVSIWIRLGVK